MKKLHQIMLLMLAAIVLFACVSPKKLRSAEARYVQLDSAYLQMQSDLRSCQGALKNENLKNESQSNASAKEKAALTSQIDDLQKQISYLKENNTTVLNNLQSLSVVTSAQAESIKKSLDNIGEKDMYIKDLRSSIAQKDSLNMALVMNLKSALNDINDKDVNIKVEKGVVYVDISDKMLFNSGSYVVSEKAKTVLGKVAAILNAHPEIDFLVEGNTDSNPYSSGVLIDNWDLSTARATSIVRILTRENGFDSRRITASGKGEFHPLKANDTVEQRADNRRTEIILSPDLNELYKLLNQ